LAALSGPGLLVIIAGASGGVALVLPESCGALPAWYAAPDPTGQSKLGALAQELGMLLLPADVPQEKLTARRVPSLADALSAGSVAAAAQCVSLPLKSGAGGQLSIIWPLANPSAALASVPDAAVADAPVADARRPADKSLSTATFDKLPHYSRSLLKIRIPVSVQLASKAECVQEIVELVPGSIIKFEKGCDELLHMVVGGQTIAEGEAVKVGDKFGFRITKMTMPREHFLPAKKPREAG
jgi:flagellar motor switch protein FliN/FliY